MAARGSKKKKEKKKDFSMSEKVNFIIGPNEELF